MLGCAVTPYEGLGEPPRVPQTSDESELAAEGGQSGKPGRQAPQEIGAAHLLVQYQGSLRAPPHITRTKQQAQARAAEALKRAKAGEDFGKLAGEYSDEPGAAERGGDLGVFQHHQMDRVFADAAFELEVGQISGVVETSYGYHVIKRTE